MAHLNDFDLNSISEESFTRDIDEHLVLNHEDQMEEDVLFHGGSGFLFDLNIPPTQEEEEEEATQENPSGGHRHIRVLCNDERKMIYDALLMRSVNGKLKRGTTKEVADLFSVHIRSVQRIWKVAKNTPTNALVDVSRRQPKNCGRKRVEIDLNRVGDVPLNQRTSIRSLAEALHVSHTTLHRRFKKGSLRRHSNAIKPHLKEENKISRLQFCISMLDPSSLPHEPKFASMYNTIHIDAKWFCMTETSKTFYLLPNEEDSSCSCQSKNFIVKVMFLAAVARPRFDDEGNEVFSGKIGVFPLVTRQPALRNSQNRPAGTMKTKPIMPVMKDVIRKYLVEEVIPAIQAKWPREDRERTIFIQQDNARTHVQPKDGVFQAAASQNGLEIKLTYQPPNSPDMNVLDLGFFRVTQSLQHKVVTKTADELIAPVQSAFEEYLAHKLNRVFTSLQLCMRETMKVQGSNKYKIPHVNKERLQREGRIPVQIPCDSTLVESVMNLLE